MNQFITPQLSKDFAHFIVRSSIINTIKKYLPEFSGTVVDLGCGNMPYKETILSQQAVEKYVSIDWPGTNYYHNKPDHFWNGTTIPLEDNSVETVLLTEVLEHLDDPGNVLKEINRILKPGGIVIGTTPFIWLLHEVPNDMQRLSPFGIKRIIELAGYKSHEIVAAGGWRTSIAQFICMFVEFGIKNKVVKKACKLFFYYPVLYLYKTDMEVKVFRHASMISSTSFKAVK